MKDKSGVTNGPTIHLPKDERITASKNGILPMDKTLSTRAKMVYVLPQITSSLLLSMGQLCKNDCIAIFNKQKLHVYKNNICILVGHRNKADGLWDVHLKPNTEYNRTTINNMYGAATT